MKYVFLLFLSMNAYAFAVNHPAPTPKSSFTAPAVEPVVTPVQQVQEPAIVPDAEPAPSGDAAVEPTPTPPLEQVKAPPPRLKPAKVRVTEAAKPAPVVAPKEAPALDPQFLLKVIVVMKTGEHCKHPSVDIDTQKWTCLDGELK